MEKRRLTSAMAPRATRWPALRARVLPLLLIFCLCASAAPASETSAVEALASASDELRRKAEASRPSAVPQAPASERFDSAFELGHFAFRSGYYGEALASWREAASLLYDPTPFLAALAEYEQALETYQSEQAGPARTGPQPKALAGEELAAKVREAAEALKARAASVRDEKAQQGALEARTQERIAALYLRGREAYSKGLVEEALSTWEQALPLVLEEKELREALGQLRQARQECLEAERKAAESASRPARAPMPAEMKGFLGSVEQLLKQRTDAARAALEKTEKEAAEARSHFEERMRRGRALLEQGDLAGAAAAWKEASSGLTEADARSLNETLDRMAAASEEVRRQDALTRQLLAAKETERHPLPQDVREALASAAEKLSLAAQDAKAQRVRAEWELSQRREWVQAKLEEGKAHYAQGRYSKAIEVWAALVPVLDKGEELAALLERFRSVSSDYRDQERLAQEAASAVQEVDRILSAQGVLDPKELLKQKQTPGPQSS